MEMEKKQGELAGINELSREGCCLCSLFCEGLGTSSALGRGCFSLLRRQEVPQSRNCPGARWPIGTRHRCPALVERLPSSGQVPVSSHRPALRGRLGKWGVRSVFWAAVLGAEKGTLPTEEAAVSSTHVLLLWMVARRGLESVTSPNRSVGEVGQGQRTCRQGRPCCGSVGDLCRAGHGCSGESQCPAQKQEEICYSLDVVSAKRTVIWAPQLLVASPRQLARLCFPRHPSWQTCWDALPLGSGLTPCMGLELPKGGCVAGPVLLSRLAVVPVTLVRPALPSLALTASSLSGSI